jgi:hypothetical protein
MGELALMRSMPASAIASGFNPDKVFGSHRPVASTNYREYRITVSTLCARGNGLNLVHIARSSANEVGAKLNLSRNSARAGKIYVGVSV